MKEIFPAGGDADQIYHRFYSAGAEQPAWNTDKRITAAARNLFNENGQKEAGGFYHGEAFYKLHHTFHDGTSANAAMCLLWYVKLQNHLNYRVHFQPESGIYITGDIDQDKVNEIIWGEISSEEPERGEGFLKAKKLYNDNYLWTKQLRY